MISQLDFFLCAVSCGSGQLELIKNKKKRKKKSLKGTNRLFSFLDKKNNFDTFLEQKFLVF